MLGSKGGAAVEPNKPNGTNVPLEKIYRKRADSLRFTWASQAAKTPS